MLLNINNTIEPTSQPIKPAVKKIRTSQKRDVSMSVN